VLNPSAIALEVGTLIGLKAAVISGIGAAFSSRLAVRSELATGLLRELPIESVKIPRRIFVAWRSSGELPLAARSFLEVARKRNAELR
jgi:phosphonate transport system ATP-binding protein